MVAEQIVAHLKLANWQFVGSNRNKTQIIPGAFSWPNLRPVRSQASGCSPSLMPRGDFLDVPVVGAAIIETELVEQPGLVTKTKAGRRETTGAR